MFGSPVRCQNSAICRNVANNCAVFYGKLGFNYQISIQKALSSIQTAANNELKKVSREWK